jgi:hypothetical protein
MAKRIYAVNDNYFDDLNSEGPSYWLGVLSADGYVWENRNSVNLTVKESDREWLEMYKKALGIEAPILEGYPKGCIRVIFTSGRIVQNLYRYGIHQKKSLDLCFCQDVTEQQVRHYIRGLIDGDGSLTLTNRSCMISLTGTEDITSRVASYLARYTTKNSQKLRSKNLVRKKHQTKNTFCVSWGGLQNVSGIIEHLYNKSDYFLLRKKEIAQKMTSQASVDIHNQSSMYSDLTGEDLMDFYKEHKSWRGVARFLGVRHCAFIDYKIKVLGREKRK